MGIVGRTGSGKTSLLRVLFGLYDYEGTVKIDGVDTSKLPLHVLRSNLAVIPQVSEVTRENVHLRVGVTTLRGFGRGNILEPIRALESVAVLNRLDYYSL